ncbi:uncharacterized protein LOC121395717 [Xenopus laevis]|uniref:Uncharacterized protein n=2 Tax=Xenopus laevis TaxID=8355 RepID=A0A974HBA5_XENLA|nr:uncharacterized protein LOC121395717 [Xenopus laevis]OCT71525.1 hypothetical protein XELAEV_18034501mg [Xenopus laevis]
MLCRVAFFSLLVLSLVQEDSCYSCKSKGKLSKLQSKVLTLSDAVSEEVSKMIHDDKHKKIHQTVKDKVQDKICTTKLDSDTAAAITKKFEGFQTKLKNGSISKGDIISFLENDPLKKVEECFAKLFNKNKKE